MAMTLRLSDEQTDALRRKSEAEHRSMQQVALAAIDEYVHRPTPVRREGVPVTELLALFRDLPAMSAATFRGDQDRYADTEAHFDPTNARVSPRITNDLPPRTRTRGHEYLDPPGTPAGRIAASRAPDQRGQPRRAVSWGALRAGCRANVRGGSFACSESRPHSARCPFDAEAASSTGSSPPRYHHGPQARGRMADLMIAGIAAANQLPLYTPTPRTSAGLNRS